MLALVHKPLAPIIVTVLHCHCISRLNQSQNLFYVIALTSILVFTFSAFLATSLLYQLHYTVFVCCWRENARIQTFNLTPPPTHTHTHTRTHIHTHAYFYHLPFPYENPPCVIHTYISSAHCHCFFEWSKRIGKHLAGKDLKSMGIPSAIKYKNK